MILLIGQVGAIQDVARTVPDPRIDKKRRWTWRKNRRGPGRRQGRRTEQHKQTFIHSDSLNGRLWTKKVRGDKIRELEETREVRLYSTMQVAVVYYYRSASGHSPIQFDSADAIAGLSAIHYRLAIAKCTILLTTLKSILYNRRHVYCLLLAEDRLTKDIFAYCTILLDDILLTLYFIQNYCAQWASSKP